MTFWGLRWRHLAPKKCRDNVRSEGSDQHGSDIFETQLPAKFQPNPTTESKAMHSESPCTMLTCLLNRHSNLDQVRMFNVNLAPKKCRDDVWFEGSDRDGSDVIETQLLIKFQPSPTTESKLMHSGSARTMLTCLLNRHSNLDQVSMFNVKLAAKKCRDNVRSEGSNRHGSDIFETQLPIKFQPNPTTESKVMPSGSPCTKFEEFP